jgi:hypothetical protein
MPWIPEELDAVVLRCLRRPPAERWGDVVELAAALSPFASDSGRAIEAALSNRPAGRSGFEQSTPDPDSMHAYRPSGPDITGPRSDPRVSSGAPAASYPESSPRLAARSGAVQDNPTGPLPATSDPAVTGPSVPGLSSSGVRTGSESAPPTNRRWIVLIAAMLLVSVVGGVLAIVSIQHRLATSQPAAPSAKTSIIIKATPADAKITFDDGPVAGNPAELTLVRDGTVHRVRVEAPGHLTQTQLVTTNVPAIPIDLTLERTPAPAPTTPPGEVTSATASAPPVPTGNRPGTVPTTKPTHAVAPPTTKPTGAPSATAVATTTTAPATPPTASSKIYTNPW